MIKGTETMTRPLLLVAGVGFVATVICFAVAAAMGPLPFRDLVFNHDGFGPRGPWVDGGGPRATRTLAWEGGDELTVMLPARVTYTQSPETRLTVTGPRDAIEHVVVDNGDLRFNRGVRNAQGVEIVLSAPNVREFNMVGSQHLTINGLRQDDVEIAVRGSGDVTATGQVRALDLQIAGSGDARLGGLVAEDVEVQIAGSGKATVTPRRSADVQIAGSGDVTFTVRPQLLDTQVFGSGRINQPDPAPAPPAPAPAPPAPAPPPTT